MLFFLLTMFASLFVVVVGLCCSCSTGDSQSYLGPPQLYGPSEALVKEIVQFKCKLLTHSKNESVLLQLRNKQGKLLGESTSLKGEPGTFHLVIKRHHDGDLTCEATLQNNTKYVGATVSNTHYLKVVEPVEGAEIVVPSGAVEIFEGKTLELLCKLTAGNYVTYKWLFNDRLIHQSPFHALIDNRLHVYRTTSKDSGSYSCVATNEFNNTVYTSNTTVAVTVKDIVSNPDVSFVVLKDCHNYSALITCQSTRGTVPITFSLYNRKQLIGNMTTEDRKARFKVPLVLGQHMGWLQCWAVNGDRTAYSQWLSFEVVPVGGPVTLSYEYELGENYAVVHLRFYCKVAKGSHPRYKWFLNDTLLHSQGSFYRVANQPLGESMLLVSVGQRSTGTYHCEASDSFDNTTGVSSKKQYMDKEVLNHLPVLVVAVVFGCFTVLILLVSVCCCIGVVFSGFLIFFTVSVLVWCGYLLLICERGITFFTLLSGRRQFGENSLLGLEMKKRIIVYEGELDALDLSEDDDVGKTESWGEFDQASDASVDEWPQMIKEKKTLEDEPVEFP